MRKPRKQKSEERSQKSEAWGTGRASIHGEALETLGSAYGCYGETSMAQRASENFQDLIVWRKAHEFVLAVYELTGNFPKHETYGLSQQLRRAAVSIPANIAEGFRRRGKPDKARFLNLSESSLEECRYYLILASNLKYGETSLLTSRLEEVSKLLNAYTAAIRADF